MKFNIKTLVFQLLIIEIIIGGGGRLFDLGGITLRMILFSLALLISINDIYRGRTFKFDIVIVLMCLAFLSLFSLTGLLNGADTTFIIEDLKPLTYLLILPFISSRIKYFKDLKFVVNAIKWGGLFMSLAFISFSLLTFFNLIDLNFFYVFLNSTNEVFFKGELSFFYKGFIFLPIAFNIFLKEKKLFFSLIVLIAILLSLTRGLYILTLFGLVFFNYRRKRLYLYIIPLTGILTVLFLEELSGIFSNASSDYYRVVQIKEVFDLISVKSLLFGNGFGIGTVNRPIHMEIAYLEILHKQGVLGLLLFCILFLFVLLNAFHSKIHDVQILGYTGILIFIQSFFNSYILNPIGIVFLLLNLLIYHKNLIHES